MQPTPTVYQKSLKAQCVSMRKLFLLLCCSGICLGIYAYLIEPRWMEVKKNVIEDSDIPTTFSGLNIIFISDIHHGPYFSRERVERVVQEVNGLNPNIIILGGDYVHRDSKYIDPCFEALSGLKAPLGIYAVLGNHDNWEGTEQTKQAMQKAGVKLLDNEAMWLEVDGARIKVGGSGDLWTEKQLLDPLLSDVDESDYFILISHNPDFAEELTSNKVDLMLSGHTHGGQVTMFGLWAPLVPSEHGQKYRTGLVETEQTTVLISNGVGTITPPLRFFARPQINLITLKTN